MVNDDSILLLILTSVVALEFLDGWFGLGLTIALFILAILKIISEIQKQIDRIKEKKQNKKNE